LHSLALALATRPYFVGVVRLHRVAVIVNVAPQWPSEFLGIAPNCAGESADVYQQRSCAHNSTFDLLVFEVLFGMRAGRTSVTVGDQFSHKIRVPYSTVGRKSFCG
jgi:hypothetical protein